MPARLRVELTLGAEQDLSLIHRYLLQHRSELDADALLARVLDAAQSLETYPERGPVPPELAALGIRDYRQLIIAPYRLVYRVKDDTAYIVLIADGRRNMRQLLEQRLVRP